MNALLDRTEYGSGELVHLDLPAFPQRPLHDIAGDREHLICDLDQPFLLQ